MVPLHDCARPHETVLAACWQLPFPSQKPVLPQGRLAAQLGESARLTPTFEQVPAPFRLHDWQAWQLELEQQTASTQLPLVHSLPAPQPVPFPFFEAQVPGAPALPVQ